MDLTSLGGLNGRDNTPGLGGHVYLAEVSDFTTLQKAPKDGDAGLQPGDTARIQTAHVFKAGKGWKKVYITLDSNQLKADITGERDGRGLKVSFEGFHPGNDAVKLEFFRRVKNGEFIMLVPDADENYFQVGTANLPLELAPGFDSGKLSSGRRGFTVKGEAYATGLVLYEADIVEQAAAPAGN